MRRPTRSKMTSWSIMLMAPGCIGLQPGCIGLQPGCMHCRGGVLRASVLKRSVRRGRALTDDERVLVVVEYAEAELVGVLRGVEVARRRHADAAPRQLHAHLVEATVEERAWVGSVVRVRVRVRLRVRGRVRG